ncbi:MAG: hypothetical protein EA349_04605 [Halomonadaceae bacterium]|nr:MAG: hypothetical protein EA349_04605 [Halomonadaceae bacterium]
MTTHDKDVPMPFHILRMPVLLALAGLLALTLAATVQAGSLQPDSVDVSIAQGQTFTVQRSVTLDATGPAANRVDVFFLADNTGSMGSAVNAVKANAQNILAAIAGDDSRFAGMDVAFGVGRYLGDPREFGSAPDAADRAYQLIQPVTDDADSVQAAINQWYARGGGDIPEANFFALHQVATSGGMTNGEGIHDRGFQTGADTGWRDGAARVIVMFGDAQSHTTVVDIDEAIAALNDNDVIVAAVNTRGSGQGLDWNGQASTIVEATGGVLVNGVQGSLAMVDAILSSVGTVTSRVNLELQARGDTAGIDVSYTCASSEGCNNVPAGDTRVFDMTITGHVLGTYEFETFTPRVSGIVGNDRVTVRECVADIMTRAKTGRVQVVWSDTGAHHYAVQRADDLDGPFEEVVTTTSRYSTYLDIGVENGNTYFYRIVENDARGNAVCQSGVASATPRHMRDRPEPIYHPPVIDSTPPAQATQGQQYLYQIMASDPDGGVLSYHLDTAPAGMTIGSTSGLIQWTPERADGGSQQVIVSVEDPQGLRTTQQWLIQVATINQAPVITSSPITMGRAGQLYEYPVKASDPDGDSILYTLTAAPSGMGIDPATGAIQWTPGDNQSGTFPVEITVADPAGLKAVQSYDLTIEAVNRPPAIVSAPETTATTGVQYQYQVVAEDPDEGDTLSYTLVQGPEGMTLDANTGLLIWTPIAPQAGSHAVEIKVEDAAGLSDEQTFAIAVASSATPPVITSTPVTTGTVGQPYEYALTADADPEAGTLSYALETAPADMTINPASGLITWQPAPSQVGDNTVTVRVSDERGLHTQDSFVIQVSALEVPLEITSTPATSVLAGAQWQYQVTAAGDEGAELTYELVTGPGGMAMNAANQVTWSPVNSDGGPHPVTVRVSDPAGRSVSQSFTLTVVPINEPPVITSTPPANAKVGETYRYQVVAQDPESEPLSYFLGQAPSGMTLSATGLLQWTPGSSQSGTHTVSVQVQDPYGASATQSFTLNVSAENRPPVFQGAPTTTTPVGQAYQSPMTATDPDGDALTWALVNAPAGMTINTSTGKLTWVPGENQIGTHQVSLTVSDGYYILSRSYSVTVVGDLAPPQLGNVPTDTAEVGKQYVYRIVAIDGEGYAVDIQLQSAPEGMTFAEENGIPTLRWTPLEGDCVKQVQLKLEDRLGQTTEPTWSIQVFAAPRKLNRIQCSAQSEACGG